MTEFLHNPKCSKSRQTKQLLDDAGVTYTERLYLEDTLSEAELMALISKHVGELHQLVRAKEAREAGVGAAEVKAMTDQEVARFLADNPRALERPVVVTDKIAVLGRPPEQVLEYVGS